MVRTLRADIANNASRVSLLNNIRETRKVCMQDSNNDIFVGRFSRLRAILTINALEGPFFQMILIHLQMHSRRNVKAFPENVASKLISLGEFTDFRNMSAIS